MRLAALRVIVKFLFARDATLRRIPQLQKIVNESYADSHDFNGISARELSRKLRISMSSLAKKLRPLVAAEKIAVAFGDLHPNPHIRALEEPAESQLKKLCALKLKTACVYPLSRGLNRRELRRRFADRPYTLRMALGEPQLSYAAFRTDALEIYRNDPRYECHEDGITGSVVVSDKSYDDATFPEADKVSLEHYGHCFGPKQELGIAAFLRYLARLSPKHQQHWNRNELTGKWRLHPEYFNRSILGKDSNSTSFCMALTGYLECCNQVATTAGRSVLFARIPESKDRYRLSALTRPTARELDGFYQGLDKLLSDNINRKFFADEISWEQETHRDDGKVKVEQKGTITALCEWFALKRCQAVRIKSARDCLRAIRKLRSKPSHKESEDTYDEGLRQQQREAMKFAIEAMRSVLHCLCGALMLSPKPDGRIEGQVWLG